MSEQQWYMTRRGHQIGPVPQSEIEAMMRSGSADGDTYVFTAGMTEWMRLKEVNAFRPLLAGDGAGPIPTPPGRTAHEIDFRIEGTEMQFVEVELDPGESAVAEAGSLMYMTDAVRMETIFGDGSQQQSGIIGSLLGAGKRLLTGESLFMTVFTNGGGKLAHVAFSAPCAGKILPLDLSNMGGEIICQKDAFLCAAKGVSIGIAFQKKIGAGLFGGEGFIMQRLQGDGLSFLHAGGTVQLMELAAGETLRVDTGCLVALLPSVTYDVQFVGGIKTALFGGEGLFFATLTGPGKVWLQSLPLSRLADRIYSAAPQTGGRRRGEGSVLDNLGIGNLVDGQ